VTALLAATGSVIALAIERIYARLTPVFLPQALAQDIASQPRPHSRPGVLSADVAAVKYSQIL